MWRQVDALSITKNISGNKLAAQLGKMARYIQMFYGLSYFKYKYLITKLLQLFLINYCVKLPTTLYGYSIINFK